MNTQVLSKITGQPVNVLFAMVGNGKAVHYSPSNDETLCGKVIREYVSGDVDAPLCKRCASSERVLSAEFVTWQNENATVEIQGDAPESWAPDFTAQGASECYFGCGASPVVVFVTHVGVTEGLCDAHRDRVEGATYELPTVTPEERQMDAESVKEESSMTTVDTVNVVQAHMGMNGMNHYHAPGCRDIARESRRHNARKNMGVYEFPFSSVAAIIEHEYSDCNNGDAQDMIAHANDDYDGLKIMSCLRDALPMGAIQGMPVEFKGGKWTLGSAPLDSERCAVCEVFGNVAENSTDIDGKHVCGYCVDNGRTASALESHSLTFFVETETGTKYECAYCRSIDTRANFAEFVCEGNESPIHNAFKDDETEDAGFVETDSVDDYSIVSRLTSTTGINIVKEESTSTGTTHHTMDAHGGQWTRFEHVLSVGDIVRSTESGRTLYEVYALIPGLPVVYVDPCDGREPFPMGATTLYAL